MRKIATEMGTVAYYAFSRAFEMELVLEPVRTVKHETGSWNVSR